MKAVIQAGGQGTRLKPYTLVLPKPLMPVGEYPIIEILLKWLRRSNVSDIYVTTGYLGHLIKAFCGDGRQWDCNIHYSEEFEPLGTIGPLHNIRDELDDTFLVLNGDLLTDLNIYKFCDFHLSHGGLLTVGTTNKRVKVDLGVLQTDEDTGCVSTFREKPSFDYQVSMGIYCMDPEIFRFVPKGIPFGFDDLMHSMIKENEKVHVYRHRGVWMDIGRPEDYSNAQKLLLENDTRFIGV